MHVCNNQQQLLVHTGLLVEVGNNPITGFYQILGNHTHIREKLYELQSTLHEANGTQIRKRFL